MTAAAAATIRVGLINTVAVVYCGGHSGRIGDRIDVVQLR